MVAAVAVSLASVGAVLGAYAILEREITRSYESTAPASATIELRGAVEAALVARVRQRPEVAEVEARETVHARIRVSDEWRPLLLFVVDDFIAMKLNTFSSESGAWPPPEGTILVERSALGMAQAASGDVVTVKTPNGAPREVRISGVAHDPGLAPAWQERTVYAYATRATLGLLGETPELHELRVLVRDRPRDVAQVDAAVAQLARWLADEGHDVEEVRVPPPGLHPHQRQMIAILLMMLVFGVTALVLGAIIVATSLAAMLARQVREIGVMKTMGATSPQLSGMYAVHVAVPAAMSTVLALPLGFAGAQGLSTMISHMLNFERASTAIPSWVFVVEIAAGMCVPLVFAAVPILRASRLTVRAALDAHGVSTDASRPLPRWLVALRGGVSRMTLLALRNVWRRPRRLALTVSLLAVAGATFMAAHNMRAGWDRMVGKVYESHTHDVEIRLHVPTNALDELRGAPGVRDLEAWSYAHAAFERPGAVDIMRTYPDGGHGSLLLIAPPPTTPMLQLPVLTGRWLRDDDTDAVVLNHMALGMTPATQVGDTVRLAHDGLATDWHVVGIVEEIGSPAVAYVTARELAQRAGGRAPRQMLRLRATATGAAARAEVIRGVEGVLSRTHASVEAVIPLAEMRTAIGDHVVILVRLLIGMALVMALVGTLGLGATMATSVVERTRELGVMRAIGATPAQLGRLLHAEALVIGLLSWMLAVVVQLPITMAIGRLTGELAFRVALPIVFDISGALVWLVLVLLASAVATSIPARRAASTSVREALAYT